MTGNDTSHPSRQAEGSVKEAIGKLTGNARIEAEGRREKREDEAAEESAPKPPVPRRD